MKHYNPSITERANRIFNLKNGDQMPDDVEGPVAVIPITPSSRIVRSTSTTALSATIYTTPADKDFYLTSATLGLAKDAASTSVVTRIVVTIDGVSQNLLNIPGITLTAQLSNVSVSFPIPLKIDRGTNILLTNQTATVNRSEATITGYTEEVTRT